MFREYVNQLLEEQSQQAMFDLTDFWVVQVNEAGQSSKLLMTRRNAEVSEDGRLLLYKSEDWFEAWQDCQRDALPSSHTGAPPS